VTEPCPLRSMWVWDGAAGRYAVGGSVRTPAERSSFPVDTRARVTCSSVWRHQDRGATRRGAAALSRAAQLPGVARQRRRTSAVPLATLRRFFLQWGGGSEQRHSVDPANAMVLQLRFDFDSTTVRRPFACLSKVSKVTLTYPLAAVMLTHLFI